MGQFPQDGNLALRVSFFWFTFERSCIHKFAPKHFLKVLDQNSGLLYPKNVKKSFENAQKMPVLDLYFQNFLQKVKFMQSLGLNYSKKNMCREEMKCTTQISCPCRFRNTPYLK